MDKKFIWIGGGILLVAGIIVTLLLTDDRSEKTQTINFYTFGDNEKIVQNLLTDFTKRTGISVNYMRKEPASYELDSLNAVATGQVDVWALPNTWLTKHNDKLSNYTVSQFNSAKMIESYKELYPDAIVTDNVVNSQIFGFPLTYDPLVMFVNTDARQQRMNDATLTDAKRMIASVTPKNWDELAEQSAIITLKNAGNITLSTTALGTSDLLVAPDILTLMMLQNGAQMTSFDQSEATFHTSLNQFQGQPFPSARALDLYSSFANPTKPNYAYSAKIGDPVRAFSEGKIIYLIDYLSKKSEIQLINPNLDFDIEVVPQVKETKNPVGNISYKTYTVPKSSPNQTVAWQLIRFISNPDNIQNGQNNLPIALKRFIDSDVSGKTLMIAQSWHNPDKAATDLIFRNTIIDVLAGQTAQTALDGAAIQVTNLLKNLKE